MTDFKNDVVLELPSIDEITFQKIDKRYFKVILINFFLVAVPFGIGLILLNLLVFPEEIKAYQVYMYLGYFFLFGLIFTYYKASFAKRQFAIRTKDISYQSGLFFSTLTTVPFSRIQHVEIDQGPIARLFQLASLSVFTAGDSSDDLEIKGITKIEALKIKAFISQQVND